MNLPLDGLLVLEFSQYLAGPSGGLRLADLGARVIKIERPRGGDACRQLAIKNLFVDGDSTIFHTVNRNKESYAADLKDPADLERVKQLIPRRGVTGEGGLVEVSMLESLVDYQFETLTCYFQDGGQLPERTASNNAHAYLGAPYGIYETADGHLALAMGKIPQLGELLGCPELTTCPEPGSWFHQRDEIKAILARHLKTKPTAVWLAVLEPADIWCAGALDWPRLRAHDGYKVLDMEQSVRRGDGFECRTTACPIRFDGERPRSALGSPKLGEHTAAINAMTYGPPDKMPVA